MTLAGARATTLRAAATPVGTSHGLTRRTGASVAFEPAQSVSFEDWLAAYTCGAAFAGGQERERGSLTPGKRADFVVLDHATSARGSSRPGSGGRACSVLVRRSVGPMTRGWDERAAASARVTAIELALAGATVYVTGPTLHEYGDYGAIRQS